jgi:G:T-mismatch repair DNA endonuclease (very short patch repair protein)
MTRRNLKWSSEDEAFLKTNYATTDNKTLSSKLGKSISALTTVAYKFNLHKTRSYRNKQYVAWTKKQIAYIVRVFGKVPIEDMAKYVHRSISSVQNKLTRLKVLIPNARGVSLLETEFRQLLLKLDAQFDPQYKLEQYRYDFKVNNLLIELQGSFWHADSRIYKKPRYKLQRDSIKRDRAKKNLALRLGYKYAAIWEYDFYKNRTKIEADLKAVIDGDIDEYDSAKSVNISSRKHRGKARITKGRGSP